MISTEFNPGTVSAFRRRPRSTSRLSGLLLVALVPAATGSWLLTCWGAYSALSWLV